MEKIRVRFAPSPTGPLHIGGVRTALYNYLFARSKGGEMVLRIEDTDQTRFVPGAEEYILKSLQWAGIDLDEGPEQGGGYAPYRQSERKEIYQQYAQQLLNDGFAYYAFDTPEELEAMRLRLKEEKADSQNYNAISRMKMTNSLTLSENEVAGRIESGDPYVVRLMVPENEEISCNDIIRELVTVESNSIDDKVLLKSDGLPTYHLANVVDDHLMEITHVIRGEEWLPSLPLHALLYKFLGWEDSMPAFAHLPLILKPEGAGKLSKRDADKSGFPIFPLNWKDPEQGELSIGFREEGYLPDAVVNFLAFLGWNPGTEKELFTKEELISSFSLERIGKAGAKFDINKAQWYNQQYIKEVSDDVLAAEYGMMLDEEGIAYDKEMVQAVVHLMKERITFAKDLMNQARFFFVVPGEYDEKAVSKKWGTDAIAALNELSAAFYKVPEFVGDNIKITIDQVAEATKLSLGKIMPALRIAITGSLTGPDLMLSMEILGKEDVLKRIKKALDEIPL